jgi:hypothetical protein
MTWSIQIVSTRQIAAPLARLDRRVASAEEASVRACDYARLCFSPASC